MENNNKFQLLSSIGAALFILIASTMGYLNIGWPPVVIVGGSGVVAFVGWQITYLKKPVDPKIILPLFLLTVAALEIHMTEEYLTHFGPAMSRLFDIAWTEKGFLMVFAFAGPTLYSLTAIGLFYRIPIAGFFAWFIFIGPGVAEFTHFIFPVLQPTIAPSNPATLSQTVSAGVYVAHMPNYYYKTTGVYYFAGMWTAALPMIPGVYAIYKLIKVHRSLQTTEEHPG
jgi:hypothetical protein